MTDPEKVLPRRKRLAAMLAAWPWVVLVQIAGAALVVAGGVALFGPAVTVFGAGWGLVFGGAAAEATKLRQGVAARKRRQDAIARRAA